MISSELEGEDFEVVPQVEGQWRRAGEKHCRF